jgi:hypothetical protein
MPGLMSRLRPDTSAHLVRIHHVDPPDQSYEPYYAAICETCSARRFWFFRGPWAPRVRATVDEAFADAREHSQNVSPDILRPLDPDFQPPAR